MFAVMRVLSCVVGLAMLVLMRVIDCVVSLVVFSDLCLKWFFFILRLLYTFFRLQYEGSMMTNVPCRCDSFWLILIYTLLFSRESIQSIDCARHLFHNAHQSIATALDDINIFVELGT